MAKNWWDEHPVAAQTNATGGVFQLPISPQQQADEARKQAGDMREQLRLKLEMDRAARDAAKAADDKKKSAQDDSEKTAKAQGTRAAAISAMTTVLDKLATIDGKTNNSGWWETGRSGAFVRGLPEAISAGSDAYDLKANLATVDANTAFSALQEMRQNSPTGGALGSVSDSDMALLKAKISNLDPNQSQAQFRANLADAQKFYRNMLAQIDMPSAQKYGYKREEDPNAPPIAAGGGNNSPPGITPPTPWSFSGPDSGVSGNIGASGKDAYQPIPPAMQQEFQAQVQPYVGRLDPKAYAKLRNDLNAKYGFGVNNSGAYEKEAEALNKAAANNQPINLNIGPVKISQTDAQQSLGSFAQSQIGGPILAYGGGVGSLGGGMDEVVGYGKSLVNGTDAGVEIAKANAQRQAIRNISPTADALGQLTTAAVTGGLAGRAVPGLAAIANTGRGAAALGAGYGVVNGAWENNDNRLGGAITGGLLGAGGGVLGNKVIGPGVNALMSTKPGQAVENLAVNALNRVRGVNINRIPAPEMTNLDNIALGMKPDLGAASQNLRDAGGLGLPYALADSAPQFRTLAGTVSRKSPDARALAEQTFDPRAIGQADRAVQAIDTHLAPVTNIEQRGKDLIAAANQEAAPFYSTARQRAAPVDPQIAAMLDTPAGKEALANARTLAANEGRDPNGLGFDLNDQGEVVLRNLPSFETLQYVKRGLDSAVEGRRNQFGQLDLTGDPLTGAIQKFRTRFNARLGELNPDYAAANDIYAGYARQRDALNMGHDVLPKGGVPQRQFDGAISNLTPQTLPEAQRGFATALADQADRARLAGNPYNSIYGSPLQQRKVATLFPEGAPKFDRNFNLEQDMAKTRAETLGGSQTATRQAADELVGGGMGMLGDVAGAAMTGGMVPTAGTITRGLLRTAIGDRMRLQALRNLSQRANQIAPALFDTSDPAATAALIDAMAQKFGAYNTRKAAYSRGASLAGGIGLPALLMGPSGS